MLQIPFEIAARGFFQKTGAAWMRGLRKSRNKLKPMQKNISVFIKITIKLSGGNRYE